MAYKPTIGLEVHAELKTKTKMFCSCKNDPDERKPNINICPVCMGEPGTLPVINKEALKQVLKVGLAVGGKLADFSEFDRKNYFYPDIPKGYQISQYKYPLVSGGELCGVRLTRIHLEEDTAKSSHVENSERNGEKEGHSLVDFNRAGVPLMELVTEPVIQSASVAASFCGDLQKLLRHLEVSHANMEKGEMRLEANVSVSAGEGLGTKVEVKNLNSFRSVEKAIEYELKRQTEILENGGEVQQETRGWDEQKRVTFSQRSKESSHDYRYFLDPDLPKLKLSEVPEFKKEALRTQMKETPDDRRGRFKNDYGIKDSDIRFYLSDRRYAEFFEKAARMVGKEHAQLVSNYIVTDIVALGKKGLALKAENFSNLIKMFLSGAVSSRGVKDILLKMTEKDEDPRKIAEEAGLFQKNNATELSKMAEGIILNNKDVVIQYKNGKISALQFLVGQGMKLSKGSANPQLLREIFEQLLSK